MPNEKITRLRVRPEGREIPAKGEGLRPVGLSIKAIRHRLVAEKQGRFAKLLPFKRGDK